MKKYKFELSATKTREGAELEGGKIERGQDAFRFCRQFYFDDINIFESFFIVMMKKTRVIGWAKIAQGGLDCTTVDVRIVAKFAIDTLATAVVLCHNHPSGDLKPSSDDKALTQKIIQGLKIFNIKVFDHIIINEEDYYSFSENGML